MAPITTARRKRLARSQFAIPAKAPESGSYPIDTIGRARNALARVAQHGTPEEKAKVHAAVRRKYPGLARRSAVLSKLK